MKNKKNKAKVGHQKNTTQRKKNDKKASLKETVSKIVDAVKKPFSKNKKNKTEKTEKPADAKKQQ